MAQPSRYLIDALRKLNGDAFVSFPDKNLNVRRVERVFRVPRSSTREAFNAPQVEEYTDTELVDQHVVGGDANFVELYQAWETLPGSELTTKIKRTSIFDVVPVEFRVGESLTVRDQKVEPLTEPDPVTGQVVESIVQQESKAVGRRKMTTRDAVTYPTLVDRVTNARKQFVTVTRDVTPTPTATPSAAQSVTRKALGGNQFLQEVTSTPAFEERTYETDIDDLLPRQFRGALQTRETSSVLAGVAVQPVLATGDLNAKEEQLTEYEKRVRRKSRDLATLPATLTGKQVLGDGRQATLTQRLAVGDQTIDVTARTIRGEVEPIGDGTSLKTQVEADEASPQTSVMQRQTKEPPRKFLTITSDQTIESIVESYAVIPDALGSDGLGVVESSSKQIEKYRGSKSTRTRGGTATPTVTEYRRNADGQLVTRTIDYSASGAPPTLSALVEDAEVEVLGDNRFLRTVGTIPSVLDKVVYEVERPEVLPGRFRAGQSTSTERHTISGAAGVPAMTAGDQRKSERQLTAYLKETLVTRREDAGLPAYDGQRYDEQLDLVIQYHEEIADPSAGLGVNRKEVQPLKPGQALITTQGVTAALTAIDNYFAKFPGTTSVDLPRELTAVTGLMEVSGSNGIYGTQSASYGMVSNGSGAINVHGRASGSAGTIPEVFFATKSIWGRDVPCLHCLFFSPTVFTMSGLLVLLQARIGEFVNPWPSFCPKEVEFVCRGGKISGTQTVDVHASQSVHVDYTGARKLEGNIRTTGFGNSYEVAVSTKMHRTSPVIHGALSLGMLAGSTNPQTTAFSANASATTGANALTPASAGGWSTGQITPTSIGATPGQATLPTSGLYLSHLTPELYKYGRVKYHATIVRFGANGIVSV